MVENLFSGAGIGLLLGFLLGLSSSPVVGVVVGALAALVASLAALVASLAALVASLVGVRIPGKGDASAPDHAVSAAQRKLAAVRGGTFGFTCLLGVIVGLYIRTHDSLSPTLQQRVAELKR
jgi:hypothetical protein